MKAPLFGLFRGNEDKPFFVGGKAVVDTCFETLKKTFFFTAGNAKKITEDFPFHVKEL